MVGLGGRGMDRVSSADMMKVMAMGRRLQKSWKSSSPVTSAFFLFLLAIALCAFIYARWITSTTILSTTTTIANADNPIIYTTIAHNHSHPTKKYPQKQKPKPAISNHSHPPKTYPQKQKPRAAPNVIPFSCPIGNQTITNTCPSISPSIPDGSSPSGSCPDYFRWIYEDLRPWKFTGITRKMVERARRTANFRLVVVNGHAYVERYQRAFQSRDVLTIWGILQLLRRYPGRVPDIDLMFDCVDWPVVKAKFYRGHNASAPPPLFRYCGDESTLDIVFPDWSFWGWPEINIKPWEALRAELWKGSKKVSWMNREPHAYWKGNPAVAVTRQQLLQCNVSDSHDWNARIYAQDWFKESQEGFKESNLARQCIHRFKIYIEGSAWSVSEKYILACDSLTLVVKPKYYDFFTRGLMPVQHYWPIREDDKCRSIKFAVDWGNSHKKKAQNIGKEASNFIQENLKMDYVYDYMFHLLSEYAKLLRYKPTILPNAIELCAESMACPAKGLERKFMMDSMVKSPKDSNPCKMPPPFSPVELKKLQRRKDNSIKQVEMWEQRA
ncbi:uncharacterized protein [Typha latifolia]|uniref:uncharacterized protein isoform X1 n=2 Tax=Typha latifolia TaxID=4733 RepID=UPI003C302AD4